MALPFDEIFSMYIRHEQCFKHIFFHRYIGLKECSPFTSIYNIVFKQFVRISRCKILTMINIIIRYLILLKQLLLIIYFILRMHFFFLHFFKRLCSCQTLASCSLSAYNTSFNIFSTLICLQGHNILVHITIYIHHLNIHRNCMYSKLQTIVTYTKLTFLLLGNLQICLLG